MIIYLILDLVITEKNTLIGIYGRYYTDEKLTKKKMI